jgi:hypothetical protein
MTKPPMLALDGKVWSPLPGLRVISAEPEAAASFGAEPLALAQVGVVFLQAAVWRPQKNHSNAKCCQMSKLLI